jgi:hypothetical protein
MQPDAVRDAGKSRARGASLIFATVALPPGSRTRLIIERGGQTVTLERTLRRRPPLRS